MSRVRLVQGVGQRPYFGKLVNFGKLVIGQTALFGDKQLAIKCKSGSLAQPQLQQALLNNTFYAAHAVHHQQCML
jgi:hypothetical protein